jgi:hypothetical protein
MVHLKYACGKFQDEVLIKAANNQGATIYFRKILKFFLLKSLIERMAENIQLG